MMIRRTFPAAWTALVLVSAAACIEQTADQPTEDELRAARENILPSAPPSMKFAVNAELEGKLVYLGLDVDTNQVVPGRPFTLTHFWQVKEPVTDGWRLFVHVEAPGSESSHLNADHVPVNGKYPVSYWKKGEIIRDIHRVALPSGWSAATAEVYVGIWKGTERLKIVKGPGDGKNRVLAARLPVSVAAAPVPKRLLVRRIKPGSLKLDGKLDEAAWQSAATTGAFVRTTDGAAAEQKTEAKALWDDKNLYIGFTMSDSDVWSSFSKRDDKLWTQEAVELFIDADGDGKTYVELQANPRGALFDSYLPAYRQNQNDYDSLVKVAVQVDGTLDVRDDQDRGWTVEMQIPLETARGKEAVMKNVPPEVGTMWRVNFFRMDLPAGKAQQGTGWAPPLVGDFHALDKFGQLVFANEQGEVPAPADNPGAKASAPPPVAQDKPAPAAVKPTRKGNKP